MNAPRYRSQLHQTESERKEETHPLTWRLRDDGQRVDLNEYVRKNGYAAVANILGNQSGEDVINTLKEANVRGRGGAGFSAGLKWSLTLQGEEFPRGYLICNADEMEPGTFKDRLLMEQLPHLLLEGMILGAYANNSVFGYIFLRGEYIEAAQALNQAILEARDAGWLGSNIAGSGFDFDIVLHTGAGRYICGEETALINSLEGKRANPRAKPPFPGQSGAWGKPTVVNNVETLCNVPAALNHGTDWYQGLSGDDCGDGGTKLFGLSGRAKRTGLWELPMGTKGQELIDLAGGMEGGRTLKAWLPGGGSTGLLLPEHLELPLDYDAIGKAGSRLGTGLLTLVASDQSVVSLLRNLESFFARESCGWCTPCRDGLPWSVKVLSALEQKKGEPGDIELLEKLARDQGPGKTFCAHAPGAAMPLESALRYFRHEFEEGVTRSEASTDRAVEAVNASASQQEAS
jgi:NADH-quinone oxidoreductase subunit F